MTRTLMLSMIRGKSADNVLPYYSLIPSTITHGLSELDCAMGRGAVQDLRRYQHLLLLRYKRSSVADKAQRISTILDKKAPYVRWDTTTPPMHRR
ncbi:hypothetical protein H112_04965 [Trichophyton rubrum D6]|uniref:Uncharacterized protein n=3 Tax=Trichophyton TaxID=5550 RepID=A0A080WRX7_TRIRC|nr:uncharacterized protein TERG_11890 [Trichophyton rubrum CBS 118892]EZF22113.1 hypothetical protein H100_04987 [Trichophyton rubrum MR850]EZF41152.1 hypothetical protein H102_04974 [Trichophyton rubrum CBS 100081]EZF51821.1 hypothetical protein H103_04976 [Trichophyton rubrum CBS 288.86]EZF62350.1 hypothetical protein H104_04968 [Trichophyton rubrum CBS 289.86]EZF73039.1 hypothetical protein H105_04994 [Trichophyton soudanense CBS 452.61]EZF83724.1 hypothetical protein H110_04974 [Trichophy